jgi:hypothetical protein
MYEFKGNCKFCKFCSLDRSYYRTRNQCKQCYLIYCKNYCTGKYIKVIIKKKKSCGSKSFKVLFRENMPIGLTD